MCHPRTTFKLLFEQLQRQVVRFRMDFDFTICKVANKPPDAQSFRYSLREIPIADTLNPSTNNVAFCPHHGLNDDGQFCIVPGRHATDDIRHASKSQLF
jgi:hypothetical protein